MDFFRKKLSSKAARATAAVLAAALVLFVLVRLAVAPGKSSGGKPEEYAEYEAARVLQILSDNTSRDGTADGGWRGEQMLTAEVRSGQYRGETLLAYNYVGPLYGGPVREGDTVVLIISTYSDGKHTATVYEYGRTLPLLVILALFVCVTVLVGGKTGLKSLLSLTFTFLCLILLLIPALMKGAPMIFTTFLVCAYNAVVCLTLMGGVTVKTVCAAAGAVAGTAFAMLFGLLSQALARVDGLREADAEALLQMRQTGESAVGLRGLLVAGIIVSSLGAVMDVTMGIASSLQEVHAANGSLGRKELFRSGLNIGRDMVGTMSNTLILAFVGSDLTLAIYLYSLGLSFHQLISSAYLSLEMISGLSSSVGVILSIPVTAWVTATVLSRRPDPAR